MPARRLGDVNAAARAEIIDAVQTVFIVAAPVAALALAIILLLSEVSLKGPDIPLSSAPPTKGNDLPDNDKRYDRHRGPRDRNLRAADSDREAIADILREQHVAGRIDSGEFEERLDRCMAAKTYADLDQLVTDFPGDPGETHAMSRSWGRRPLPFALLPLAFIAAIALSGGRLFWLAIPVFFLLVVRPLLWRSWGRGYGWGGAWGCGPRYTTRRGAGG